MFVRSGGDGIYTDSNDSTASRNGHSDRSGYSVQDKIIAFSSIALGVIGFTIFFCYYCTPLVKAHRRAKAAKKRHELLKPFSRSRRRLYGLDDTISNYSSDSKEFEPITPERIVTRDSIGLTKARQAASPIALHPFLSHFPAPPRSRSVSAFKQAQAPFSNLDVSFNGSLSSTPPKALYASLKGLDSSFVGLPHMESFPQTFFISDSQDFLSDTKIKLSTSSSVLRQAQSSLAVLPVSSSTSLAPVDPPAKRVCGMVPPRSSSLNAILSSSTLAESTNTQDQDAEREACWTTSSNARQYNTVPSQSSPPVYADVILPSYFRESSRLPPISYVSSHDERRKGQTQEYSQMPSSATSSSETPKSGPLIQSLHVQDTVLARASSYTRGLVVGLPPKSRGQAGTELQFEMVKKRESLLFW